MKNNLLIAHGGGPTAVINASLAGVILEAKKHGCIDAVYGANYGVQGILNKEFIDLSTLSNSDIESLMYTPASALGSSRKVLEEQDFKRIFDILKKYEIRYFFYNGGNGSMATCDRINKIAKEQEYDLRIIGIPKTIDNDLAAIDHSPGYGSAARYIITSAMELACEVESLPIHVVIMEVMGRDIGWLAASAALAQGRGDRGPHLIYLPEVGLNKENFLEDVKEMHEKYGGVLIIASEGLKYDTGEFITNKGSDTGFVDGFGNIMPGGVGEALSNLIVKELGIKSRYEKPGLLGRASISLRSDIDVEEAKAVGEYAVRSAVEGKTGYMVCIKRNAEIPYSSSLELVDLKEVACKKKMFPTEWINDRGNGVKREFIDYLMPLVGQKLPEHVNIRNR